MINLKNILVELEFKTPAEFATYKKKHKMRPGTVVKVAGKDKVVGDDKPKGKKTADTLTKGLKDGGLNPYKDGPLINQALDDIGGDHSDLKKRIDTYGDNVPSSKGKSEAQYQKEIDKYKEEGEKLSNDIADAVSDKPKGKKTKSKPMPQPSDFGGDMDKYTAALNKRMKDDEKPKGKKPKGDEKSSSDKPDIDPKIDKQMSSAADKANMKMDRDEINGILKKKDEPFADEVEEILYDKFKKMGSTGKKLKQKLDTIASYEMGIYDMSEKEYNQERKEVKKELDNYYKEQGLDESLKELSKISTRYNR